MIGRRNLLSVSIGAAATYLLMTQSAFAYTPSAPAYQAGTVERLLDIINLHDQKDQARELVSTPEFGYNRSGPSDDLTLRENVHEFDDRQIIPLNLVGINQPELTTELLGTPVSIPIFVPPMAAHGLAHVQVEEASARGAGAAGALFTAQTPVWREPFPILRCAPRQTASLSMVSGSSAAASYRSWTFEPVAVRRVMFAFIDLEPDGTINAREWRLNTRLSFERADLDGDGASSEDDFRNGWTLIVMLRADSGSGRSNGQKIHSAPEFSSMQRPLLKLVKTIGCLGAF